MGHAYPLSRGTEGGVSPRLKVSLSEDGRVWGPLAHKSTEDETVGWHYRLDGHEFEQAPGVGDGQGDLACCSLWGRKESDTTE